MDRFWSKVQVGGESECWPWLASTDKDGYGQFRIKIPGRKSGMVKAHRFACELMGKSLPWEFESDHLCHDPKECKLGRQCPHRRCCNPDHIKPSTRSENTAKDRRHNSRYLSSKTHCSKGHPFTPENTYQSPTGRLHRQCRTCRTNRTNGR